MMRLMVFTPTYGDRLRPETAEGVESQRFNGHLTWEIGRHNPYPYGDMRNVTAQYQRAREICLAGSFDAMLTVEHDMVIPLDAAQKLCEVDAGVVYAPYMLRHGSNVLSAWQFVGRRNLGMSLSLYPEELAEAKRRVIVPVSGVGFGCTLIRHEVLERIPFRDVDGKAPDIPFAIDCLRSGIVAMAHFGVPCGHIEDGEILTIEKHEQAVRVLAVHTFVANVNGRSVPMKQGARYTVPSTVASELVRAGFVRVTGDATDGALPADRREISTDKRAQKRSKR